jgi:hypothetical protein
MLFYRQHTLVDGPDMSIELHIFIQDSRVPTAVAWQEAIQQAGFPTALDPALDVRRHRGFSRASYKGKSTGFEFALSPASDTLEAYPDIAGQVGDRNLCATFRWGGDFPEMCAAISAAAALAKLCDGVCYDPEQDILSDADEALSAARENLDAAPV